jgi:hypothetical protein
MFNTVIIIRMHERRKNSSVSIAMGYRLDGWVQFLAWVRNCSPLHSVQTGSGAPPVTNPMSTVGFVPEGKGTRA